MKGSRSVPLTPTPGGLSAELLQALDAIKTVRQFPQGATLFHEGSPAAGIYLVESGEVRILLSNNQTQKQLLEVVRPGTVFGLSECLSGEKYRTTAEADDETTVALVAREKLIELLRENGDFCMEVLRFLIGDLHALYHKFRGISAHPGRPRRNPLGENLN
jgi:CRP-like cAMP-binding protein